MTRYLMKGRFHPETWSLVDGRDGKIVINGRASKISSDGYITYRGNKHKIEPTSYRIPKEVK